MEWWDNEESDVGTGGSYFKGMKLDPANTEVSLKDWPHTTINLAINLDTHIYFY